LLLHAGGLRGVVTSPALLVGLVLQLPVSLGVWLLVRRLLSVLEPARSARRALSQRLVALPLSVRETLSAASQRALPPGRGPPALLRP
ncbi:MAG: hypothetical protein RMM28_11595, partial [Thermoleophilia bacterium]|nr:hypothetical protein [Thermoleophilia bacterium]